MAIGNLQSKFIELVKILRKRRISIACVQKTKRVGTNVRDVDEYKLWYLGSVKHRNGVGIFVDEELRGQVVEVKQVNDRLMSIRLVIGGSTLVVINAYTPQSGLDEEKKRNFWETLDEVVRGVPSTEMLFIGHNFNGHIGSLSKSYDDVHSSFDFGDQNEREVSLLDFARDFGLRVENLSFPNREKILITFCSLVTKTQIDFFSP
ncbi:craniofacial development protein 2-like [Capsicum annuum]|uniref:craniofacial development protein 2-like n=1 Tax=Capsicum annuum TaxID=4072 RepID=UPI001FB14EE0|nr:craniofacial development protein 2-like [Capsicum annuum]